MTESSEHVQNACLVRQLSLMRMRGFPHPRPENVSNRMISGGEVLVIT